MTPPKLRLIGADQQVIETNTLPSVGKKTPAESLPVVLATGFDAAQTWVPIPQFDSTTVDNIASSIIKVVSINLERRYLKIRNNGTYDVELWLKYPSVSQIGKDIMRGEVLKAGETLTEVNTCRTNEIYATSLKGTTGLSVVEG